MISYVFRCKQFQKLPVKSFQWKTNLLKFNKVLIRNYDEKINKGYILEVTIDYPKDLHDFNSDIPFLPERMKISKCNKFICNLYDKNSYVFHLSALKQTLDFGLIS